MGSKIIMFHPETKDVKVSQSESNQLRLIEKGYIKVGYLNGWKASVSPII